MKMGVLKTFAERHSFLATPEGSRNRCIDASIWFLQDLGIPQDQWHWYMRSNVDQNPSETEEHHWVQVDGINIDWTARQFDPSASFPKMWA